MRIIKTASECVICNFCDLPFEVVRYRAKVQKFCSKKCEGDSRAVLPEKRLRFIVDENGCWLWTGCLDDSGYAAMSIRRKTVRVHVFTYTKKYGPIPAGKEIDHLCRIRRCINPDHLEPVTSQENTRRGARWGAAVVCSEIAVRDLDEITVEQGETI